MNQPASSLSRRTFLRRMVGGGAAIALGSLMAACGSAQPASPPAAQPPASQPAPQPTASQPAPQQPAKQLSADVVVGFTPGYEKFFQTLSFDPYIAKNPGVKISQDVAPVSQIYAKLLASKGSKPPVHGSQMNDPFSWTGVKDGMWQTVTAKEVPNFAKVPAGLHSKSGIFYALNLWGVTYNPKFLPEGIKSWKDLYNPKLKGKVGMWPAYFDAYIMAAKAAGKDEHDIEVGIEAWKKAKDNIGLWVSSVAEVHQAMDRGEIWAAPDWGSTAVRDAAAGMSLAFAIPEEGAVMNTYYIEVLKGISESESQAMFGIFDTWLSDTLQQELFKQQYLTPVVTSVTPDLSKLPFKLDFKFTAEDAVKKLYRPDYAFVGDNTKKIVDLINQNLK